MYLLDYPKRLFIIFCFIGFLTFSVWHASFFIWTFFSCSDLWPFFLFFFSTQNNIRFRIKECYRENVCQAYVWHAYFFSGTCFFCSDLFILYFFLLILKSFSCACQFFLICHCTLCTLIDIWPVRSYVVHIYTCFLMIFLCTCFFNYDFWWFVHFF